MRTSFAEGENSPSRPRASVEIDRLVAAERAARLAGEAAIRWRSELQAASDSAVTERGLGEFLEAALDAVRDLLEADTVSLLVTPSDGDELVARASVGIDAESWQPVRIPLGSGMAGRVAASKAPMLIHDLSKFELASPVLREHGVRSVAAVPVVEDDRAVGVLHAGSHQEGFFDWSDVAVLTIVADRLAVAMERVRLFESERASRSSAERMVDRIARLQAITAALSEDLDADQLAHLLCHELAPALASDLKSCTLWLARGTSLRLVRAFDAPDTAMPFVEMPLDADLPGPESLRSDRPLWLASRADLLDLFPELATTEILGERFAILPLRIHDERLGVLALTFEGPGEFAATDRDFLLAVAEQAAQAFDRARLRELERRTADQQRFLAATSAALAESLDFRETLNKVVRLMVPEVADLATIHLFDESARLARVALAHRDSTVEAAILAVTSDGDPAILSILAAVARGTTILLDDASSLLRNPATGAEQAAAALRPLAIQSVLWVPLSDRGQVLGVLSLALVDRARRFDDGTRDLAEEIGRRAAVAITNARLHSDLKAAQLTGGFLLDVAKALAGATGFEDALERLGASAVPTLGDLCLIDVLDEEGRLRRLVAHHADAGRQPLVDELHHRYPPDPDGVHPSVEVIGEGTSRWSSEMSDEFLRRTCRDERHFELTKQLQFTSFMAVPLAFEGDVLGALTLVSAGSGRRFGAADLSLAEELAAHVATVVDRARRYDREHRISHTLQASLLPATLPHVDGARLAVRYLPGTRGAEVGGDFYDAFVLRNGRLIVIIGDVAGHDHHAAAVMGHLRSAIRTLFGQMDEPEEVVAALKAGWEILGVDRMATALFCQVDLSSGVAKIVSAGHPPPLVRSDGEARFLQVPTATPLGAPGDTVAQWQGTLVAGEVLLLYTDGVIDDRISDLDDRLDELAHLVAGAPADAEALCDQVVAAMGTDRSDDVALLALSIEPRS